jgi:hypothetical protein
MSETPEFCHDKMRAALDHLAKIELEHGGKHIGAMASGLRELDVINENEEDESEEGSSAGSSLNAGAQITPIKFSASEVSQAFSHFSYLATGRKRLICDLQGVFDEASNTLKFTDPVIHYFNHRKQERENVHGRTDRGRKGVAMFFGTHKDCCGHLCRLVTGGFKKGYRAKTNYKSSSQHRK